MLSPDTMTGACALLSGIGSRIPVSSPPHNLVLSAVKGVQVTPATTRTVANKIKLVVTAGVFIDLFFMLFLILSMISHAKHEDYE
jgi:hypothetical protein